MPHKTLYLGTDPTQNFAQDDVVHYPVIQIVATSTDDPKIQSALALFDRFTHIVFTSKNGVRLFFHLFKDVKEKKIVSVGRVTTKTLLENGVTDVRTACNETQDGVIGLLKRESLDAAFFFLPCSAQSRPLLREYLRTRKIPFLFCPTYETEPQVVKPIPNLDEFDRVVFTSPSVVEAFFAIYPSLPSHLKVVTQGEVTKKHLASMLGDP